MNGKPKFFRFLVAAFLAGVGAALLILPLCAAFIVNIAKEGQRSDWFGFVGTMIGTAIATSATLFAGWLAWHAVQIQIRMAKQEARDAKLAQMTTEIERLCEAIDLLKLAAGFLRSFTDYFAQVKKGGFTAAFVQIRMKALDTVSSSAAQAPYGFGNRIVTAMNRIDRIGDRMMDARTTGYTTFQLGPMFDETIENAVNGIATIADQLAAEICSREKLLISRQGERDLLRSHS